MLFSDRINLTVNSTCFNEDNLTGTCSAGFKDLKQMEFV